MPQAASSAPIVELVDEDVPLLAQRSTSDPGPDSSNPKGKGAAKPRLGKFVDNAVKRAEIHVEEVIRKPLVQTEELPESALGRLSILEVKVNDLPESRSV